MPRMLIAVLLIVLDYISTQAQTFYFDFISNTGNDANIVIPASISPNVAGVPLSRGDEIGVFTADGLCVGAIVWRGRNAAIAV